MNYVRRGDALLDELTGNVGFEGVDPRLDVGLDGGGGEDIRDLGGEWKGSFGGEVRAGDTVSGEDGGEAGDDNGGYAEAGGDGAGMLTTGTAE